MGTFGGAGLPYTGITAEYVRATSRTAYESTGPAFFNEFTMTDGGTGGDTLTIYFVADDRNLNFPFLRKIGSKATSWL